MIIIFDQRWVGLNGIGRFAMEVANGFNYSKVSIEHKPVNFLDSFRLAIYLQYHSEKNSVFYSPGYNAPLWSAIPFIFTMHDLNHIDRPENSSLLKRMYYALVLRSACRRAEAVLTVSEYSKTRICNWSGISSDKVINVGNGVSNYFGLHAVPYTPGYPYLLCVGNRKGHKNEARVLEAFARVSVGSPYRLLFTGASWLELQKQVNRLGVSKSVIFTGRVDDEKLAGLYRGARMLVFPSLYEGFGLPILEAFACGTPTLTSNVTAMPEVAGDAALLVNPESIDEIAGAMRRLMHDEVLRASLIKKGLARVKSFTWTAVVGSIRTVLDHVADKHGIKQ